MLLRAALVVEFLIAAASLPLMVVLVLAVGGSTLENLPGRFPSAGKALFLGWAVATLYVLAVLLCVLAQRIQGLRKTLSGGARLAVQVAIPTGVLCGLSVVCFGALSAIGAFRGPPSQLFIIALIAVAVGALQIPYALARLRRESPNQP